MLHPLMLKKLKKDHPDIFFFYNRTLHHEKIKNSVFFREVQNTIKSLRRQRSQREDALAIKLSNFGNCGQWAVQYLSQVYYERKMILSDYKKCTVDNTQPGKWRSIEFELVMHSQIHYQDFINFALKNRYHNYISLKGDNSITRSDHDNGNGVTREIVVSYPSGKESMVRDVCAKLRESAYINKSCGTHVHLDMRHKTFNEALAYGMKIAKCAPALKSILPASRRNSKYCIGEIDVRAEDRYRFINMCAYNEHRTIELRGHSGTIDAEKILNWIKICETIMESHIDAPQILTAHDLISKVNFSTELQQYITNRAIKFTNPYEEEDC